MSTFRRLAVGLGLCCAALFASAAEKPAGAAIASAHPLATAAGFEALNAGGNAFDAAVAISAALAVVEPAGSGLGGGGFWLLHRASDGLEVMVDGRERAPLAAKADMYLDQSGKVIPGRSINGALAAGIPGLPAGLDHLARRYGRLPLKTTLAPAIHHANEGFRVDRWMHLLLWWRRDAIRASPEAAARFLRFGIPALPWMKLRQPDLAKTLGEIADKGAEGFYKGEVAGRLVEGVREAGGIWTLEDLAQYRIVERKPLRFRYRGLNIVSAPPPSSGGIVLAETLGILGDENLAALPASLRVHLTVEAMRRAYRDRNLHLGDPDHVRLPLARLLSPEYAAGLRNDVSRTQATPSTSLSPAASDLRQGPQTTHFSVIDRDGNYVAATLSVNLPFGSGFMPPATGVLLNNEMDDFSTGPGQPNAYGLVQSAPNAIAPGKRMLSSMTPTFVSDGERTAILGTPGGSRIISMVLLATLAFGDGAGAETMVSLPRYHHQYLPDQILHEVDAFSEQDRKALADTGHALSESDRNYGNMQVVIWNQQTGALDAASDPRGIGFAEVQR